MSATTDLFVIGGGIDGTGLARIAAGRSPTACLVEQDDLARATSSAFTGLLHGRPCHLAFMIRRECARDADGVLRRCSGAGRRRSPGQVAALKDRVASKRVAA
jgi:glycerol-3-phosphate dehydrogenase